MMMPYLGSMRIEDAHVQLLSSPFPHLPFPSVPCGGKPSNVCGRLATIQAPVKTVPLPPLTTARVARAPLSSLGPLHPFLEACLLSSQLSPSVSLSFV